MTKYIIGLVLALAAVAWYTSTVSTNFIDPTQAEVYVREHISELSPRDEVLGGIFFVTSVTAHTDGTGVVEYEDGHNAFVADFTFTTEDDVVEITSFEVRE